MQKGVAEIAARQIASVKQLIVHIERYLPLSNDSSIHS